MMEPGSRGPPTPPTLRCAISGEATRNAVISRKSGTIYEKGLIEKALSQNGGICPKTGTALSTEDLVRVQTEDGAEDKERTGEDGVGAALGFLQEAWDGKVLELHEARKMLAKTREELGAALYRCEAGEAVVAGLRREIAELRGRVREGVENGEKVGEKEMDGGTGKEERVEKMDAEILKRAMEMGKRLQQERKTRTRPMDYVTGAEVGGFGVGAVGRVGEDGEVVCDVVVEGVVEGMVGVGRCLQRVDLGKMERVGKRVEVGKDALIRVRGFGNGRVIAGERARMGIWGWEDGKYVAKGAVEIPEEDLSDVDRHCLDGVVLTGRQGGEWHWRDFNNDGRIVASGKAKPGLSVIRSHPDGMIFATGGTGGSCVEMWDAASGECVARLEEGVGAVMELIMSEKGYYMGICAGETVRIWDLRKPAVVGVVGGVGQVQGACFDDAGEFGCVVGGGRVALYTAKKKARVVRDGIGIEEGLIGGGFGGRVGCAWGVLGREVLVGGNAHLIKFCPTNQ